MATWQPNASATTDTTAIHNELSKLWSNTKGQGVTHVDITRLAAPGSPAAKIGQINRDEGDTVKSMVDAIAEACSSDAERMTGEQKYDLQVTVLKKTRNGDEEQMHGLGRLRFGTGSHAETTAGGVLKEATAFVKGIADYREKEAETDHKRLKNLNEAFDLQTRMLVTMNEAIDTTRSMNQHAVRALELTLQDARDQREADREDARAREAAASEERQHQATIGVLRDVGRQALPMLQQLLPAIIFKMNVETAKKAKDAGVNVPPPAEGTTTTQPEEEPAVSPKIEQVVTTGHIVRAFFQEHHAEIPKIHDVIGDDMFDLLKALANIPSESEQFAICTKLVAIVKKMSTQKQVAMYSKLSKELSGKAATDLNRIMIDIQAEVTPADVA